ncbi:hypothetical protein BN871_JF_00070 [Paenibacillus sp. P22]|nr:hypothetical protein BN871_JF_00070 [Paenibacillus sp. P22]
MIGAGLKMNCRERPSPGKAHTGKARTVKARMSKAHTVKVCTGRACTSNACTGKALASKACTSNAHRMNEGKAGLLSPAFPSFHDRFSDLHSSASLCSGRSVPISTR